MVFFCLQLKTVEYQNRYQAKVICFGSLVTMMIWLERKNKKENHVRRARALQVEAEVLHGGGEMGLCQPPLSVEGGESVQDWGSTMKNWFLFRGPFSFPFLSSSSSPFSSYCVIPRAVSSFSFLLFELLAGKGMTLWLLFKCSLLSMYASFSVTYLLRVGFHHMPDENNR